jgi:hypothetical protein
VQLAVAGAVAQAGLHDQSHARARDLLQALAEVLREANNSSIWARLVLARR